MEPFVLLMVAEQPAHGYELARAVAALGFRRAARERSVVYKLLRRLEQQGYLTSEWTEAGSGPPPRIYRLTAAGHAYLDERAADLDRQARRVEGFLTRYRSHRARRRPR